MILTTTMISLGKVYGNLMVDLMALIDRDKNYFRTNGAGLRNQKSDYMKLINL